MQWGHRATDPMEVKDLSVPNARFTILDHAANATTVVSPVIMPVNAETQRMPMLGMRIIQGATTQTQGEITQLQG